MKIKPFAYTAEQSFKTSPNGERLFYFLGGVWSKPYIIPDAEIERQLFKKQLWLLRIFFGTLILGQPLLFIAIPDIIKTPLGVILYFLAIMLLYCFVNWRVFRKDLVTLKRENSRLPFLAFFRESARKTSVFRIVLSFLGCLGFVWIGSWILKNEINPFVGWMAIILFGFCAIMWSYILFLKLTMPQNDVFNNGKTEA